MRRRQVLAMLVGAALVAVSACSASSGEELPAEVADRPVFSSCGEEDVAAAGYDSEGRACLWDAWNNRREAEFISTFPTVEGDPVTIIYRARQEVLELFVDERQDAFGSGEWLTYICQGFEAVEDPEQGLRFELSMCGEPRGLGR